MSRLLKACTLLMLIALLAACGGTEEQAPPVSDGTFSAETIEAEPTRKPEKEATTVPLSTATSEPEPTATPLPKPTETPTPEPTDIPLAGTEIRFDEVGVAFNLLDGWEAENFIGSILITKDNDPDNALIIFAEPLKEGETIDTIYGEMLTSIAEEEENVIFDVRVDLSVNGLEGFSVDYIDDSDGELSAGSLALLTDGTIGGVIAGRGTIESWEGGQSEAYDAIISSISYYEPIIEEDGESAEEEATSNGGGQEASSGEETSASPSKTSGAGSVAISSEPGSACFGSRGEGMACISAEGEWQRYTEDTSELPSDYITGMTNCGEHHILLAHTSGLSIFDGTTFRRYDAGWGYGSPDDLACDAEGGIWVGHFEGISYFDGSTWTTWDTDTYFAGDSLVNALEIAPDGTVWVVTSNNIGAFASGEWTLYEEDDFGDLYFFDALTVDSAGVPWAGTSDGLLYFEDGGWAEISSPDYLSIESIVFDADGAIWMGTFNSGLEVFEAGAWLSFGQSSGTLSSDRVNTMVYDGSGRLWVATDYGVTAGLGDEGVVFRMDNSPIIVNEVDSMAVLGAGPTLPDLISFTPGGIVGTVEEDGSVAAERRVEICVESLFSTFDGSTPCEGQPLVYSTTTDENGAFAFEEVLIGRYVVLIESSNGWAQMTNEYGLSSEMVPVNEGEVTDLGTLTLTDEE